MNGHTVFHRYFYLALDKWQEISYGFRIYVIAVLAYPLGREEFFFIWTFASVGIDDRITEAGVKAGLFKSISEARKTIKSGGVYLNNTRVEDEEQTLQEGDFLHGRFVLIRRGKKALGVVEQA